MPDREAVEYPESFASEEEMRLANDPKVGAGSPSTAPEQAPSATLRERLRERIVRVPKS